MNSRQKKKRFLSRKVVFRLGLGVCALFVLLLGAGVLGLYLLRPAPALDAAQRNQVLEVFGGEYLPPPPKYGDIARRSFYVPMHDGVRIAVDVLLPEDLRDGVRLPAVFIPTRYWRSWDLRFGLDKILGADRLQRMLVAHGYAVILVDARGSGASFGNRAYPWSPDERQDYVELMDWAVAQPWCDGNLAASGISYSGTAAEFMAMAGHPALKAVLPQFSLYDVYTDIAFPGGVFNLWFVKNWGHFNRQLDLGQVPDGVGLIGSLLVRGPTPVPPPMETESGEARNWGYQALEQATREHAANVDIYQAALQATFRDDVSSLAGVSVDAFSPHTYVTQAKKSPAAWYSWGGWHDGAYAGSLLKRFCTVRARHRAVIGPWNHGGVHDTSPFHEPDAKPTPPLGVHYLEQIRFLDHYLKGEGPPPEPEIRYYTLGEGRWKSSATWPPEGMRPRHFYLHANATLAAAAPEKDESGHDVLRVNQAHGSGEKNRWRTQILRSDVIMPPRPLPQEGSLSWTSPPLSHDMECTGQPELEVFLDADAADLALFAYLEDVAPDGATRYVSEAPFRLLNRKIAQGPPPYVPQTVYHTFRRADALPLPEGKIASVHFALLPVSYLFHKGHRVRLTLAGNDKDQFTPVPQQGNPVLRIHRDAGHASMLELPVR